MADADFERGYEKGLDRGGADYREGYPFRPIPSGRGRPNSWLSGYAAGYGLSFGRAEGAAGGEIRPPASRSNESVEVITKEQP